ncbi:MAG: protease Do [Methylophilales bacterium RIFCSPHIGHO2_02_FULL_57_10]|nr:MAG: protease Do [Methylophilales bacterium RIFCSPHIGHO2_02_FULL_57_10]
MMHKILALGAFLITFTSSVLAKDLPDFTELVEKQGAAVVNISTVQTVHGGGSGFQMPPGMSEDDPFYEFFRRFAPPGSQGGQDYKTQSLGSGFILSADGYVLTNAHVVNEADEVIVKLTDRREFKAKIIGSDRRADVALLKIDATGLPKVTVGDPNQLKVGEWVVAIGSPFGLENTVTAGIVSAKGRALPQENYVPFIQTDVAINPGNSGGPLFNMKGEVVGINSQIYSRSGGYMGLSFAIPIDVALDIQNQLKAAGKVSRGWLGIGIQEITKELAESFGMKNTNGALVAGVEKGSPADKGGLEAGDVITRFDGKPINTSSDLPRVVGATKPGKEVTLEVLRKGATRNLSLKVGEMPDDKEEAQAPRGPAKVEPNRLGLQLRELNPQQKKKLGGKNGLLVINVQGSAAQAGIRRGDVILAVNNIEVQNIDQFNKLIDGMASGKTVALLVLRGDNTLYVPVKVNNGK